MHHHKSRRSSGAAVGPFFLLNTNIPVVSGQPSDKGFEAEGHALNLAIKNVGASKCGISG